MTIEEIQRECQHQFCDASGNRVYLYCQRGCGTRDSRSQQGIRTSELRQMLIDEMADVEQTDDCERMRAALDAFDAAGKAIEATLDALDWDYASPPGMQIERASLGTVLKGKLEADLGVVLVRYREAARRQAASGR